MKYPLSPLPHPSRVKVCRRYILQHLFCIPTHFYSKFISHMQHTRALSILGLGQSSQSKHQQSILISIMHSKTCKHYLCSWPFAVQIEIHLFIDAVFLGERIIERKEKAKIRNTWYLLRDPQGVAKVVNMLEVNGWGTSTMSAF